MGHEPVNSLHGESVTVGHLKGRLEHIGHSMLVDVASVLEYVVFFGIDGLMSGRLYGTAGLHDEMLASVAVNVEHGIDHTGCLFGRLNEHGGRTVAKERTGGTVGVVDHRRHFLGRNHNHLLVKASADIRVGI